MRLMGWVARTSHNLSRQSVNMVPMNWLVIFIAGVVASGCWGIMVTEHNPLAIFGAIPGLAVFLAFLISFVKRDTFFTTEPLPTATAVSGDAPLQTELRWTGKLRLHEKAAKRFIDMPAMATRLEGGEFAVVSNIDASTRFYGVVTNSKVGAWLALPQPHSFEIEAGTLYYGFRGAPALRMRFLDGTDSKKGVAILSFDAPTDRDAFYSWLEAEKATASGHATSTVAPVLNPSSPFATSTNDAILS
ncbi:hypothetical protein EON80_09635 [bacterium]|nr:MAG: hypothetical protein EON80_09635 [bacterium]